MRKNKIETEIAPGKSGLVFGLQAKKKKAVSLSKSFELDEDRTGKKPSRIDRSMVGEFNFFRETSIRKPSDLTKNIQETVRASPPHVTAPRLLHKPPPLPARTKTNDSGITKKVQDKRKPPQNRWKKGAFGSNSFIATSSEVEINEEEDDEDEEPMEAVRLTKKKRKKLPSINASFGSSLSSVNSVCLETNFDDCAPKLTEEKDSWQLETEFSSDFVPNEDDGKLEADVIAQVNKLPAQQEDGDAWQMNGTEINRFCHDLLSNLQEINLVDYRQSNNIQTQKETSSGSEDSDFQMEAYSASPKRRHSFKIDSQIKGSSILRPKSPKHEVEEAAQPPSNQVCIQEIFPREQISVENSPSATNDEDDDDDDEEEKEEEREVEEVDEEGEKIERVESKETAEIPTSDVRGEVSTDEETREDSGSVAADESTCSTSSGSELGAEREDESLKNSIEKETSDDDDSRENCNNDYKNSHHVSDVNNNDDDTNNNNSQGNSSAVKSTTMQFIDTDESEEEWPAPPSAEILNSLISRPSLFPKKHDNHKNAYNNNISTGAYNNNTDNSPIVANKRPLIQTGLNILKEHDKQKSNSSADFQPPAAKADVYHLAAHTSPSPTYRDAILERAGALGFASSLKSLKGYMAGMAYKKVEFKVNQNDGNENEGRSFCGNKTTAGEVKSSLKFEPEIDRNYKSGGESARDERTNVNSSPWQFEEPGKNHIEDKNERRSGEKKSVRFLEDDPKLSDNEISRQRNVVFKTFVQPEELVCRPNHSTYTSSRWHDPTTNKRQFFSTNMPTQINGEKQTMRFAFDERHAKKEARPNEDGMTSPVTVHEYGELISFSQPFLEGSQKPDTLDELAEQTINEVVTNKCTVREAVKNILKNRKDCSERAPDNLWSQSNDGARLPLNFERRLENYPMFLTDVERHTKRLGMEMAASHARLYPGINNPSVKLPEPHFVWWQFWATNSQERDRLFESEVTTILYTNFTSL